MKIEAEEIGSGLAHGWRQWYMIPGTRLDHLMLFEIHESSDRRATRTLKRIMREPSSTDCAARRVTTNATSVYQYSLKPAVRGAAGP